MTALMGDCALRSAFHRVTRAIWATAISFEATPSIRHQEIAASVRVRRAVLSQSPVHEPMAWSAIVIVACAPTYSSACLVAVGIHASRGGLSGAAGVIVHLI